MTSGSLAVVSVEEAMEVGDDAAVVVPESEDPAMPGVDGCGRIFCWYDADCCFCVLSNNASSKGIRERAFLRSCIGGCFSVAEEEEDASATGTDAVAGAFVPLI